MNISWEFPPTYLPAFAATFNTASEGPFTDHVLVVQHLVVLAEFTRSREAALASFCITGPAVLKPTCIGENPCKRSIPAHG